MADIKHTVCTVSGVATGIGNGHAVGASVDGLNRIDCVTRCGCPADIHPSAISITLLPLIVQARAIGVYTKGDVTPDRGVLVSHRLGGNIGWGWWFLKIV